MYVTKEPLSSNFKAKFILIKDSAKVCGLKILKTILSLFRKENVNIHMIYYESMKLDFICHESDGDGIVNKTDASSDPLGWNKSNELEQNLSSLNFLSNLCSGFKGIVCIDSLSPLLLHNCPNEVYKTLYKILKDNAELQLVAIMHSDVHALYENEIIEKLASTVLDITPSDGRLFSTIHYSSGKVSNQLTEFKISDIFEFSVLRDVNIQTQATTSKQPDPTANLTFNLKLKEDEKEARSQLQLPYMEMLNKDVIEADDDMYDEEDPDDDLDI